jgi:hypothetical protein
MRSIPSLLPLLVVFAVHASGQTLTTNAPPGTNSQPLAIESEAGRVWSFSASVYTYILPDDDDYAQPTVTFDHDWLHLEARYDYEDRETGSVWVGYNFSGGDKLAWEFTPMLGGVFGNTDGVAPGYKGSLSWWKLELYSEAEYVFDTGDSADNFFYTWSELSLSPVDWFRFGLVVQRTKLYQTDYDIQRGLLVGLSYKKVDFTTYVFNPDASRPTIVLGLGVSF